MDTEAIVCMPFQVANAANDTSITNAKTSLNFMLVCMYLIPVRITTDILFLTNYSKSIFNIPGQLPNKSLMK